MAKRTPRIVRAPRMPLAGVGIAHLHAELRRRTTAVKRLERKRATLAKRLAALDHQIASLGGRPGRLESRGGRPRNAVSLVAALAKTLSGKTMGVTEAAEAVQKDGYVTTSSNFRTIVNGTLLKHKDTFKNVARGQYTAK